jgi:hypothetical protein
VSLLKKAGSTVMEYFVWDLPKVLNQGEAELLQYADNRGSLQSRMWLSPTKTLIAKGSSQNLVRLSTTRIVSHYMTLFLVLRCEKSLVLQWTFEAKMITIDDITLPVIASTICNIPAHSACKS